MPWQKMRFRGDVVWVQVDDTGRTVLDSEGRAEMKYREQDTKTYRPGAGNLSPFEPGSARATPDDTGTITAKTRLPAKRKTAAVPHAMSASAAGDVACHVWTDGACSGNPGPMAIGVVITGGFGRQELGEYLGVGTNNIAELVAIERGLELASKTLPGEGRARVRVYSDSSYAIGLLDKGWKAKANQDLVARIRRFLLTVPANIEFVKVQGHAGVPENERCDQLAREAIIRRR